MPENEQYLGAFWLLSPDRASGFGIGYIPTTSVLAYAFAEDIEFIPLLRMMRLCDGVYLAWHTERAKEEARLKEEERDRAQRRKQFTRGHR